MPKAIDTADIIGEKYGLLTVCSYLEKVNGMHYYLCDCSCGKTGIRVSRSSLLKGDTRSCGCLHKQAGERVTEDLSGRHFGRLHVIGRAPRRVSASGKARRTMWLCECECGTVKEIAARALKTGMTTSCGCLQKEHVSEALTDDLTGKRFGLLTVICRNGSTAGSGCGGKSAVWHCRCDCGNELDVPGWLLKNGDYSSCGCKKTSKYELYVCQYLEQCGYALGKDYFREKTYPGLVGETGWPLRFDFLVNLRSGESVLIECQGKQHYVASDWFGGEEAFRKRQLHDAIKRDFAKKSLSFRLIEVPYTCVLYSNIKQFMKDNFVT